MNSIHWFQSVDSNLFPEYSRNSFIVPMYFGFKLLTKTDNFYIEMESILMFQVRSGNRLGTPWEQFETEIP